MKVAVIGAGSWGTALANVLASNDNEVCMWARKPEVAEAITNEHRNPRYLSNAALDPAITLLPSSRRRLQAQVRW